MKDETSIKYYRSLMYGGNSWWYMSMLCRVRANNVQNVFIELKKRKKNILLYFSLVLLIIEVIVA